MATLTLWIAWVFTITLLMSGFWVRGVIVTALTVAYTVWWLGRE